MPNESSNRGSALSNAVEAIKDNSAEKSKDAGSN